MNNSLLVSELLKENYPLECETVGTTNLQDIVETDATFTKAENGSYMDLSSAIGTLTIAAAFIKNVLDIYVILKKELGRDPQKYEIEIQMVNKKDGGKELAPNMRDQLIKAIFQKLSKKEK
jgi:hypothetical protein